MSNKKTRYFVAVMGAILAIGLGTGLVASYMGLPVSVFSSAAGPEELQYVPADAAVVAYANVRDVMNSAVPPAVQGHRTLAERQERVRREDRPQPRTGRRLGRRRGDAEGQPGEQPRGLVPDSRHAPVTRPRVSKRSPSSTAPRSANTRASASSPITTTTRTTTDAATTWRSASSKPTSSPSAASRSVKAAIDARASNRNIVSNNDMMKLVNEIDNANAWAVGKFDAIASKAGLPTEIASAMPAISWFSAAGHINGGVSGTFKAEPRTRRRRRTCAT